MSRTKSNKRGAALDYVLEGQLLRVGAGSTAPLSIEELGKIKDRIGGAVA